MGFLGFSCDLQEQLAFYGSYHHNKWNQIIHFIFVPLIMWSVVVWACYTGPLPSTTSFTPSVPSPVHLHIPEAISRYFVPNLAAVVVVLYGAYYILLEWFAGITWGMCVGLPMYFTANVFYQHVPHAWVWALAAHVVGWYMQIHPGHMMLEKRKPALLDSFFQSLVLAPLFVWMELLFLCGYRKQLQNQLRERIEANIADFQRQSQAQAKLLEGTSEDEPRT